MNNTILFTPSVQQLEEIAKEHPELNEQIKADALKEIKAKGVHYVQNRLSQRSSGMFEQVYNDIVKNNGSLNVKSTQIIKELIEKRFNEELEKEFETYLKSPEFKKALQVEVQQRMIKAVVATLDNEIAQQAKQFINQ